MKTNHHFIHYLSFVMALILISCTTQNEPLPEQAQNRSVKRGVSYSFQFPTEDAALLSPGVSWFYNWGPNISDALNTVAITNKLDFFPMAWNGNFNEAQIRAFKLTHPNCEYILAYNEPNLTDQANMTPKQAAAIWPQLKALATELNMKIISPAMNYGTLAGYGDPIVWLDEFFTLIPLSDIDGIAVHCYMGNASSMVWFLNRFKKYDKPIWLTEFCAWENFIKSSIDQIKYMSDAVNYLECDNDVVRYAWFIPRASGSVESYPYMQLLTKTAPYQLSAAGKVFVNMSTQDKSIYYPELQQIPAEHYSSLNMAETVASGTLSNSVRLRPTTDTEGELEVFDFLKSYWLEYQVNITNEYDHVITFRYASAAESAMEIYIDGTISATCNFPSTTSESNWSTLSTPLILAQGKHTIRLKISSGSIVLNWISINKK